MAYTKIGKCTISLEKRSDGFVYVTLYPGVCTTQPAFLSVQVKATEDTKGDQALAYRELALCLRQIADHAEAMAHEPPG